MRLLRLGVEASHVVEELEGEVVADLLDRGLRRDLPHEPLGVRNVEFLGNSARCERSQERMEATHHPCPMTAEIPVAFGEEAQDLGVVSRLDAAQVWGPKGSYCDRESIVGVVLVGAPGGEHPDATGQGGRHIEHFLAPSHQLLS